MTGDSNIHYSLTFDADGARKNTWDDWGLIPESPPTVDPPEPVTNFVTIPGRTAGALDLSKAVFGRLTYSRMSGSWSFIREVSGIAERRQIYEEVRYWLHGRTCKVILEEQPGFYFQGMFAVSAPQISANMLRIGISFNLEPVRYNMNGIADATFIQDFAG